MAENTYVLTGAIEAASNTPFAWAIDYMCERYGEDRVHCRISQCDYRPQKCGVSIDYGTEQKPWGGAFVIRPEFNSLEDKVEKLKRACDVMDERAAQAIEARSADPETPVTIRKLGVA